MISNIPYNQQLNQLTPVKVAEHGQNFEQIVIKGIIKYGEVNEIWAPAEIIATAKSLQKIYEGVMLSTLRYNLRIF